MLKNIRKLLRMSKKSSNFAPSKRIGLLITLKIYTNMTTLEIVLYSLLFVLIGLMLVSFFLVWQWFDARDRLKVVREATREHTKQAIRHSHNKCRILLYTCVILAIAFVPIPCVLGDYYNMLVYPGVVFIASVLILFCLRSKAKMYLDSMDEYIEANEQHVLEAAAERERQREQWVKEAPVLNPQAQAIIKEALGDNYETWYKHDILVGRNVLANRETGMLYSQGIIIPFSEIMEVRPGRKDLKLVTSNSMHPFITMDFGALPVNPETGNKYMDEIADLVRGVMA